MDVPFFLRGACECTSSSLSKDEALVHQLCPLHICVCGGGEREDGGASCPQSTRGQPKPCGGGNGGRTGPQCSSELLGPEVSQNWELFRAEKRSSVATAGVRAGPRGCSSPPVGSGQVLPLDVSMANSGKTLCFSRACLVLELWLKNCGTCLFLLLGVAASPFLVEGERKRGKAEHRSCTDCTPAVHLALSPL